MYLIWNGFLPIVIRQFQYSIMTSRRICMSHKDVNANKDMRLTNGHFCGVSFEDEPEWRKQPTYLTWLGWEDLDSPAEVCSVLRLIISEPIHICSPYSSTTQFFSGGIIDIWVLKGLYLGDYPVPALQATWLLPTREASGHFPQMVETGDVSACGWTLFSLTDIAAEKMEITQNHLLNEAVQKQNPRREAGLWN